MFGETLKTIVIIPAKNEADNIKSVILDVRNNLLKSDILVVNDNSSDLTAKIAEQNDVIVLSSSICLGIGAAVQTGLIYAVENDYDIILRMDGDGQHSAKYLNKLIESLDNNTIVIGSRSSFKFLESSTTLRRLGSRYFFLLFKIFTGKNVNDPTSGMFCISKNIASLFKGFYPDEYPEIESLVLLSKAGFKIKCVDVEMNERMCGESSINLFRGAIYMINVSISFFISFCRKNPYRRN